MGKKYYFKVRAYTKATADGKTAKGIFSEVYELYSTPLQITNLKAQALDDGSVKFTWDKLNNVHGYTLYSCYADNNNKIQYQIVDASTENSIILKNLDNLPSLTFNVAAFVRNSGVLTYGPVCQTAVLVKVMAKPQLTAGRSTDTDITLNWTSVDGATAYVLEKFDFNQNAWTEVATINSDRYTDSGAASRGALYRVYAKNNSGVRSPVSNEVFAATTGISITQDGAAQTITWAPFEGAAKYRVLAKYTDSDRGVNRILANTTTTSAVVSLTPGTIQSLSVFAYTSSGDLITEPVVSELVFRVDNFKIFASNHAHYDHSVNAQLLYLVEAINKARN